MVMTALKTVATVFLAALFSLPASATPSVDQAVPGSLNYVEGQVSMDAKALDSGAIGSAQLQTGQSLTTKKGKAEILLTPGVFLRLGSNSSVRMISPSLTDTEV
ncbi:MAG: hypothetical protein WBY61_17865, partial [Terriglobales bacterium]